MSRLQVLILTLVLLPAPARAACHLRATGTVRFEGPHPTLVVFAGSLSETKLNLLAAPGTDASELRLHLLGAKGRKVTVSGTCAKAPAFRRGEVRTDLTRVQLTLPDRLKPNDGDDLQVDPG